MREGIRRFGHRLVPGALVLLAACAGDHPQTMIRPVTEYGRIQIGLWAMVTWITVGILLVVFGVLAVILIRFRDRPGRPDPKPIYGNSKLEITWTAIPALIILFIAIPTIRSIFATQGKPPPDALEIQVTGHQWWWEFSYPQLGVTTANEFYVPVGRPVALELRSADVIHSFWIPRLGGKKDANPVVRTPEGVAPPHLNTIVLEVDSAGEYLGQCAEFCGASHAQMRMRAVAVSPAEFDAWVRDMKTPVEPSGELAKMGKEILLGSTCIACHTIEGTSAQGKLGPNLSLVGERWTIGAGRLDNTPENIQRWVLHAPELKDGIIMPGAEVGAGGMPPTGLSEEDAHAVAAYLSDLRRPLYHGPMKPASAPAPDSGAAAATVATDSAAAAPPSRPASDTTVTSAALPR